MNPDDELASELRGLPSRGPDLALRDRTLRAAHARFRAEHARGGRPLARRARHLWDDVFAPALLVSGAAVYLVWALRFCAALGQHG